MCAGEPARNNISRYVVMTSDWRRTGNKLSSQDQAITVLNSLAGFPRAIHHNVTLGRVLGLDNFVFCFFFLLPKNVTCKSKILIPEKSLYTFQNINLAFSLTNKAWRMERQNDCPVPIPMPPFPIWQHLQCRNQKEHLRLYTEPLSILIIPFPHPYLHTGQVLSRGYQEIVTDFIYFVVKPAGRN